MQFHSLNLCEIFILTVYFAVSGFAFSPADDSIYIKKVAEPGSNVTLECKPDRSNWHSKLWMKDNNVLTAGNFVLSRNQRIEAANQSTTLIIRNAQMSDEGNYTCLINSMPNYKMVHSLHISDLSCKVPDTLMFGGYDRTETTSNDKNKFTIGHTIHYYCFAGYKLVGATTNRCTRKGWTDSVPVCEPEFIQNLRQNLYFMGNKLTEIETRLSALEERNNSVRNQLSSKETLQSPTFTKFDSNSSKRLATIENQMTSTIAKQTAIVNNLDVIDEKLSHFSDLYNDKLRAMDVKLTALENKLGQNRYNCCHDTLKRIDIIDKRKLWEMFMSVPVGKLSEKDGFSLSEFTWVIDDIEDKIKKYRSKSISFLQSPEFYSDIPGYRILLEFYPDDRLSGHLGIYIILRSGLFDDVLSWPLANAFNMTLVSHIASSNSVSFKLDPLISSCAKVAFQKPSLNNTHGCGFSKFIEISSLLASKDNYIRNGAITIKFSMYLKRI